MVCDGCGAEVEVPPDNSGGGDVSGPPPGRRAYDFDAEIVSASRSRPTRPVKTPARIDRPLPDPPDSLPPPFDLELVRRAPRLVGFVSWLALALLVLASAVFLLGPGPLGFRCVGALAILVLAGVVFVALQVLKQVARAVSGLADQQRGLLGRIMDEEG